MDMSDCGTIVVKFVSGGCDAVYLYTHHRGDELARIVRQGLRRADPRIPDDYLDGPPRDGRWDDPAYLSRVIFDCMKGDDTRSTTGFAISPYFLDSDYPA